MNRCWKPRIFGFFCAAVLSLLLASPPAQPGEELPDQSQSNPTTKPSSAYCYQERNLNKPDDQRYLVLCHSSLGPCDVTRGPNRKAGVEQAPCKFVDLREASWNPVPKGYAGAWYQYSPTPFGSPFPNVWQGLSEVEEAEGNLSGKIVYRIRGRNPTNDWADLVKQLQQDGSLKYLDVVPPGKGGLCQTYMRELYLPGCSERVIELAESLNPQVAKSVGADQKIKVPILPLHAGEWTIVLDRDDPSDVEKLADLETRWEVIRREERGTQIKLHLKAYDVFLPRSVEPTRKLVTPTFDKIPSSQKGTQSIQKNVISVPSAPAKNFADTPLRHFEDCRLPGYSSHQPAHYSWLLSQAELPDCAKSCVDTPAKKCPRIELFDTKVFLHPGIKSAVEPEEEEVLEPGPQPGGSQSNCPTIEFNRDLHHGTMMASIMVGQDGEHSQFIGIAPGARLRAWSSDPGDTFAWRN